MAKTGVTGAHAHMKTPKIPRARASRKRREDDRTPLDCCAWCLNWIRRGADRRVMPLEQLADQSVPAQPGHAVRGAGTARAERLNQRRVAADREQPRGEVLRGHEVWRACARETDGSWRRLSGLVNKLLGGTSPCGVYGDSCSGSSTSSARAARNGSWRARSRRTSRRSKRSSS